MPLYEYQCGCGKGEDILLSFQEADQSQVCKSGKVMQRKISLSSIVMKQTGSQMALNTLNARGGGFPDANKNKDWVQQKAFAGTQSKTKTVF